MEAVAPPRGLTAALVGLGWSAWSRPRKFQKGRRGARGNAEGFYLPRLSSFIDKESRKKAVNASMPSAGHAGMFMACPRNFPKERRSARSAKGFYLTRLSTFIDECSRKKAANSLWAPARHARTFMACPRNFPKGRRGARSAKGFYLPRPSSFIDKESRKKASNALRAPARHAKMFMACPRNFPKGRRCTRPTWN